jgi:hypothetical protein
MEQYQSLQLGGLANKFFQGKYSGAVIGVTSKGIFLKSGRDILFLTDASYKSPFNIQIKTISSLSLRIQVGDFFATDEGGLSFPAREIRIGIPNAKVWMPQLINGIPFDSQKTRTRIDELYSNFKYIAPDKGWMFLRNLSPSKKRLLTQMELKIIEDCKVFSNQFSSCNLSGSLNYAAQLIGLGGGLTPSGDDWITGFILVQSRVGIKEDQCDPFLIQVKNEITNLAFEKTTTISASRFRAACMGWSEEMFLEVIDKLIGEDEKFSDPLVYEIVNFGHSSGIDTCMGIFAALETFSGE